MFGINKGYNVKLNGVYTIRCPSCWKPTKIQDADGQGLCGNCDYRWQFSEDRIVGRCEKCNVHVTVKNWIDHDTETTDEKEHPSVEKIITFKRISNLIHTCVVCKKQFERYKYVCSKCNHFVHKECSEQHKKEHEKYGNTS